nr:MAG TPA: hypothetical protein [Bacteriophage sp.]
MRFTNTPKPELEAPCLTGQFIVYHIKQPKRILREVKK